MGLLLTVAPARASETSDTVARATALGVLQAGGVAAGVITAVRLVRDEPTPTTLLVADYVLGIGNAVAGSLLMEVAEPDSATFGWGVSLLAVGLADVALGIVGSIGRYRSIERMKVIPMTFRTPGGATPATGFGIVGRF